MFASKPYISAAMWFALQDFAARPGWSGGDPLPDPPFVQKGAIDINGNPVQPLFSAIQSIYTATVQIALRDPRRRGAGLRARTATATVEPAAHQRRDHPEAVARGELLALLVGAGPVVDRHLEDPLAAAGPAGR